MRKDTVTRAARMALALVAVFSLSLSGLLLAFPQRAEALETESVTARRNEDGGTEVIPTGEQYGFAVRKDNTELRDEINASLDRLVANGTYERIFKKYFPNLEPSLR